MSLLDDALLITNLQKFFNLDHFVNKTQKEAVKEILTRKQDVLVSMPPGSRKSLCFQLPGVLQENKTTIVVSPLITSIKDQLHCLKKSKICAKSMTPTISANELERVVKDLTSKKPETRFLYVTPEQVHTKTLASVLQSLLKNDKLAYFVVDEAHCASQRVRDFQQDYLKFGSLRRSYSSVPWIALTHNASTDVSTDIVENLQFHKPVATFRTSSFRKHLYYDIIFKNTILDTYTHLKNYVICCLECVDENNTEPCGIIYCKDRTTVELVAKKLTSQGIFTKAHHGGLRTKDRKKVQEDWMAGVFPIITSTTSFAADIDKTSIRFVVHWDVPRSVASYYKESGMAGRDGQASFCRIYYSEADVMSIDANLKGDIAKSKEQNKKEALRIHADFLKITNLCETVMCRHQMFSDYFEDVRPNCKDECDVCKNPNEAKVALDLFRTLSTGPIRRATSLVDLEEQPYGRSIKLEHPDSRNQMHSYRPPRNVSPSNTIIKEEDSYLDSSVVHNRNLSEKLFEMQTQLPGNVSPARTMIKEERDSEAAINRLLSQRCVSPAETLIDEKPSVVNTFPFVNVAMSPNSMCSGDANPHFIDVSVIKNEPKSPQGQPITLTTAESQNDLDFGSRVIKQEPPTEQATDGISRMFNQECRRSPSPTGTIIKDECRSPEIHNENLSDDSPEHGGSPSTSKKIIEERPRSRRSDRRSPSPTGTIIKDECRSPEIHNKNGTEDYLENLSDDSPANGRSPSTSKKIIEERPRSRRSDRRSPSPTGTIIKDECRSPEIHNKNGTENYLENFSDDSPANGGSRTLKKIIKKRPRSRSRERGFELNRDLSPATETSPTAAKQTSVNSSDYRSDVKRDQSTEPVALVGRNAKSDDKTRRLSFNDSSGKRENSQRQLIKTKDHQRAPSRRRSRSNSVEHRSFSDKRKNSPRQTERYQRSSRRSRSRSNERFKRDRDYDRSIEPSSSSFRKKFSRFDGLSDSRRENKRRRTSHGSDTDDRIESKRTKHRRGRTEQYSSESESDVYENRSTNTYSSTQPSTSKNTRKNIGHKYADMRYSVSPEKTVTKDDSDSDYGWEDPAPPKLKPEPKSQSMLEDPSFTEKIQNLKSKLQNEYDWDVIQASKKEMFQAIEETIALEAQRKLNELDRKIQKEKDDYVRKMFGTDNFDSWDDDPALSNVDVTAKLKPFKCLVPDDISLLEKMSMKHVMNAKKLTPARVGNELVFHGHIKEIENEFQGQPLPRHFLEALKKEKSLIAGLVKQSLQPYYNNGRIQSSDLFGSVARQISHLFYSRPADEKIIKKYIDDLFKKVDRITDSTKLQL